MITSLKIFFRSLQRNKIFSFTNILGLTVGFFASILIYLYVQNELSYDNFHENGDRIYRINQTFIWGEDNPNQFSSTGPGVAYAINEDIPEVEQVVKVHPASTMLPIKLESKSQERFFKDEYIFAVDSNFLEVFTFPLKQGDIKTALDKPRSVVLKSETAKRFFGNEDPMGKTLEMYRGQRFTVTGVLENYDKNSYIGEFDLLVSINTIDRVQRDNWSWMWTQFETFVLIDENVNPEVVRSKIKELPRKHTGKTLRIMEYASFDEYLAAGKEWNLFMQPFEGIYLNSEDTYNRLSRVGDMKIVAALIGSAIFLLILSCINFINLSTAQFTSKAKDVALRKILGGSRMTLVRRFFGESLSYCVIAAVFAILLVLYTLPLINQSLGTNLTFEPLENPMSFGFLVALIGIVSMVSGFYPFVFFNSFKTVSTLKGEMRSGKKGILLRNGMLVTQYALSFLLIIGTLTIYKQLNYVMNADLGFERNSLITIENAHWTGAQEEFANELLQIDGIKATAVCDAVPLIVANGDQFIPDKPDAGSVPLNFAVGDQSYVELLEVELKVGRSFDDNFSDDVNGVLVNETAAEAMGWAADESILNKRISNGSGEYHIIGVVKDFNFWSLHGPIEPFAIFHSESNAQWGNPLTRVAVRAFTDREGLIALEESIKMKWEEFAPNRPYESIILSDHYESFFTTEKRFGGVLSFFSVLTIIIASLGLFGIVVFSIEQKLKEIGVRKVLGATTKGLVILFSKVYIKLLLIAFLIALPSSYFFMQNWLSDFEYHVDMGPGIFIGSLSVLLVISLSISIAQTVKASLMNPAEVLKDE